MLFKIGGRKFEDVRIKHEDWPQVKPTTPQGSLPFLEVDGVVIVQSNAINRYLARKFGLAGRSTLEEAQADMVVDTILDAGKDAVKVMMATPETKAEAQAECSISCDAVLAKVEDLLVKNNGGDGYFVGGSLTWADIAVYNIIEFCNAHTGEEEDTWSKFPKLNALKARIEAEPKIATYLLERPDRPY